MVKKLCENNKEALRWCKTRKVKITFEDYKGSNENVNFVVHLGTRSKFGNTLIQAVNKWIKHFNKKHECEGKVEEEKN